MGPNQANGRESLYSTDKIPNTLSKRDRKLLSSFGTKSFTSKKKKKIKRKRENPLVYWNKNVALAGNRTRATRVAGENSTTEPPVPHIQNLK